MAFIISGWLNVLKIVRSHDWWEGKIPLFMTIGYLTVINSHHSFSLQIILHLGWLISAILIGAMYVSVINDISDVEIDQRQNKNNFFISSPPFFKVVLPFVFVIIGLFFTWLLYPDWLSISLYIASWVVFSLYSFSPFRLKSRGIWGVLADASGAHLFPALFIVVAMNFYIGESTNPLWFVLIVIWSLMYGLRGILWHQFSDLENDTHTGVKTFATSVDPKLFRFLEVMILAVEIGFFLLILYQLKIPLISAFLIIYLIIVALRRRLGIPVVIIIAPHHKRFQIFMDGFYQVFLPYAVLITEAFYYPFLWLLLLFHIVLFPGTAVLIISDLKGGALGMLKRLK